MSRYAITLKKPKYSKIETRASYSICFTTFLMVQFTVMASDLLILGAIIVALSHPSILSWGIVLFALAQWAKAGAFQFWKKENILKFYRVMCIHE